MKIVAIYVDHAKLTRNTINLTYICGFIIIVDQKHFCAHACKYRRSPYVTPASHLAQLLMHVDYVLFWYTCRSPIHVLMRVPYITVHAHICVTLASCVHRLKYNCAHFFLTK
jgi:hypothetical protein